MRLFIYIALLIATLLSTGQGFAPLSGRRASFKIRESTKILSRTQLYFFFRNNNNDNDKGEEKDGEKVNNENDQDTNKSPFLAFLRPNTPQVVVEQQAQQGLNEKPDVMPSPGVVAVATATADPPEQQKVDDDPSTVVVVNKEEPIDKIAALRAQADRARLEAEKMDAELTLAKITRLEKEVARAQRKGESTDELFRQMENLQRKMRGEPLEPVVYTATTKSTTINTSDSSTLETGTTTSATTTSGPLITPPLDPLAPFSQAEFDRTLGDFNSYPAFLQVLLARSVGMQPMSARDINATEYAIRSEKQSRLDFSFVKDIPPPQFTTEEIENFKKSFKQVDWREKFPEVLEIKELTDDEFVLQAMKEEYYYTRITKQYGVSKGMAEGFLSGNMDDAEKFAAAIEDELTRSQPYQTIEGLFPKCVQKEGQIPTKAQIKMLMSDILPKAGFNCNSGEPIEVFGGFLIRGDSKKEKGDDLIDSIDVLVNKNPMLKGKLTITYLKDISGMLNLSDDQLEQVVFGNLQPRALYVMGPDVSRERNRFLATATSALGIGTCWYLSIYPFLLNPALMKRAEEQMSLADASMAYDLNWLTDLSFPLFVSFLGLQFAHEAGHRVAAAAYGLNVTFPTFVPSLASGITSTITDFKDPPKNREQLFDFAIAGPLTGITMSLVALYAGLQITAFSDANALATFPALPLEILRQSSLGGGFIEYMLGNGVLSIPDGARGTQAVSSINIPLHPVAIAGYISLIVNSLSLLPIGVTDGGRISQAIFNRAGKQIVGQLFLLIVFAVGILGDDLFLFYAFFCSFFAQGSEIPQRNEVDEISYSRVLLATATGVVALLSIIPMQ